MMRIGAVSYLNSKPLIEGLAEAAAPGQLRLDFPSRLADQLRRGELDVALIPSIEYFRADGYEVISDACVAARGPVLSVKVYFRTQLQNVKRLALDVGSRTSASLARILLAERAGVRPALEPLPLELDSTNTTADAVLLIGDRAMTAPAERFVAEWDLAEEWTAWTGLPFVFALWAGPVGAGSIGSRPQGVAPLPDELTPEAANHLETLLSEARDRGERNVATIARREATILQLDEALVLKYLTRNLHFRLGPDERAGLEAFYQLAVAHQLAPEGVRLVFRTHAAT
jgi:chorismate dehydratase